MKSQAAGFKIVLSFALIISFASDKGLFAQWSSDPNVNTPVCVAARNQQFPLVVSDGANGALICWWDLRNSIYDIYVQRVSSSGIPLWTLNGVPITLDSVDQADLQLISDGFGGAIIVWRDGRNFQSSNDIYAQRIGPDGTAQWASHGIPVCTATGDQQEPVVASDGAGGAIVAWQDLRSQPYLIYSQRMDANGIPQWTQNGVSISDTTSNTPRMVADGAGGAIIVYRRFHAVSGSDIYAQRLNASGSPQWGSQGLAVCQAPIDRTNLSVVRDEEGGVIASWEDYRNGADIYAQRVTRSGTALWMANGVPVCTVYGAQRYPRTVADNAGGALITWSDQRSAQNIYVQRINSSGTPMWTPDGVQVCSVPASYILNSHVSASDGKKGVIITWVDIRGADYDIYAQRVDSSGAILWTPSGQPITTAGSFQISPTSTADQFGGAIISWADARSSPVTMDIYAQNISANGDLGGTSFIAMNSVAPAFSLHQNYPNPFNPSTSIRFGVGLSSFVSLKVFDMLGREIATLISTSLPPGDYEATFNQTDLPSGVYFYRLQAGQVTQTRKLLLEK